MSNVKWKVYLLFALITLSMFFSIFFSSDRSGESGGNITPNLTEVNASVAASVTSISRENSVSELINELKNGNHETRLAAATRLGQIGEPAADSLIEELEENSSAEANNYLLLALVETGDKRAEETLSKSLGKTGLNQNIEEETEGDISEDLLQALKAKDQAARKRLADSLNIEYKERTDILEEALKSEEQNSTVYATYTSIALSDFGPDEPGDETEKLIKALKSEDANIRIAAMMALGGKKEVAAVEPISRILTRDYPIVQSSAAIALGEIEDEGALPILLKQIKDSDNEQIRSNCAIALGKIGSQESVPYLIDRLRDNKAGIRSNAALALGKMKENTAIQPMLETLESGKTVDGKTKNSINAIPDIRKSVVLALGEIGSTEATETLIEIMSSKEEALEVKMAAVSALGEIGNPQAIEALKKALNDTAIQENLRNKAFLALGKTGDQEAAQYFVEKIGDRELGTTAKEGLKDMGMAAVDPLIENLKTENKRIKDETALLLIEIGDQKAVKSLVSAYQ
ncbi:MAG: HEAT repeat domain-containing protein [Methanosarcina sp.]